MKPVPPCVTFKFPLKPKRIILPKDLKDAEPPLQDLERYRSEYEKEMQIFVLTVNRLLCRLENTTNIEGGFVLRSPNGTKFKVTVTDLGVLLVTAI